MSQFVIPNRPELSQVNSNEEGAGFLLCACVGWSDDRKQRWFEISKVGRRCYSHRVMFFGVDPGALIRQSANESIS